MIVTSFRAILLLILFVSTTFTSLIFTGAHATTNLVTVTPTSPIGTPENKPPIKPPGVLDGSSFRIIPSTPRTGSDVRVIGLSFAATASLDLYIGTNKINSFTTNDKGNFIITTKISDDQPIGSVSFFVKDQIGN